MGSGFPQEISVVGIDDIALSRLIRPKLTTVATPTAAAGRTAVDMLLPARRGPPDHRTGNAPHRIGCSRLNRSGSTYDRGDRQPRPPTWHGRVLRQGVNARCIPEHPQRRNPRSDHGSRSIPPPSYRRSASASPASRHSSSAPLTGCGSDDRRDRGLHRARRALHHVVGRRRPGQADPEGLALYTQEHPNVTFKKTWQANQGYYEKLGTLTAGNATPDIFQIDDNYLSEYADKNVTLDLTNYKDARDSTFRSSRRVSGSTASSTTSCPLSPWAENTQCLVYNKTALQKANVAGAQDRHELGGPHRLGEFATAASDRRRRDHGPERRLQGVLGVAAQPGQGPLQGR